MKIKAYRCDLCETIADELPTEWATVYPSAPRSEALHVCPECYVTIRGVLILAGIKVRPSLVENRLYLHIGTGE